MISHQEAKRLADAFLRTEISDAVVGPAVRDRTWGVWVVADRDRKAPDEMLLGGALVVTDDGLVYRIDSVPGAVDRLMISLGRLPAGTPDAWEREGEGLTLLADLDLDEAHELAAYADRQHSRRMRSDLP